MEASVPTSAQQRGALHAHILVWLKTRIRSKDWQQLPSVSKTVLGKGSKQKSPQDMPHPELPRDTDGKPITHEDSIYHKFECGRVLGEMVRPDVSGQSWGGYGAELLRIAGLARAIQIKLISASMHRPILPQRQICVQIFLPVCVS